MPVIVNAPAPGISYFTPAQIPAAGTALDPQPDGKPIPKPFRPLKIRGVEFQNRIWLSPLCQYSAEDGKLTPWHIAHLGGIVSRGPGLTFVEATAVVPEGRITPQDSGLWSDDQIAPLRAVVEFAHSQNQKIAIQLGHAGRKASTVAPWLDGGALHSVAPALDGGWPDAVVSASAIRWSDAFAQPTALTKEGIAHIVEAYVAAAKRALKAGVDVIEIHGAHGYLLTQFLSPNSNQRTDEYGGSFENRTRFALEIVDAVRAIIPPSMPLFFRISATEWLENVNIPSWKIEDTNRFATILAAHGVDLLDISSAGNNALQELKPVAEAYQAPLSEAVRAHVLATGATVTGSGAPLLVSAVGGIKRGELANAVLENGQADVVFVGRWFQKNPGLVWQFAEDLGVEIHNAHQIQWGFRGRAALANKGRQEKGGLDVAKEKA